MNEKLYVQSASSLEEKINRIDAIIDALILQTSDVATQNSDLEYYTLDDGQTKITTAYRDVRLMPQAVSRWQTIKQMYINQLNGRGRILRSVRGMQ